MSSRLGVRSQGPVSYVTLGDGTRHNALRRADWVELQALVRDLGADPGVRCVVLRGRGGTFCSGSDLATWASAGQDEVHGTFADMESAFRAVEELPVPVIAVLEGAAAGAGCQLAMACDLRVIVTGAQIGMPTARLGIRPTAAFAARLTAHIGPGRARDLLYTGRMVPAAEAFSWGLGEYHVEPELVLPTLQSVLDSILAVPSEVIADTKAAVLTGLPIAQPGVRDRTSPTVVHRHMRAALTRYRERSAS